MIRKSIKRDHFSAPFWVLAAFLVLLFFTGGGARSDIQSLLFLRPVAALVCAYGLYGVSMVQVRAHAFLFGLAAVAVVLVGLHLLPLPPALWGGLPGRDLVAEVDRAAGLGAVWRPIGMIPDGTWNAMFSLLPPIAVLLLGVQLDQEERFALVPLILGLGLISGLVGLLQVIGPADGPLYLYRVTNEDSAVGLFSNRNHAAVFLACLFPLLAIFAWANARTVARRRFRTLLAVLAGAVLFPLILVTGSRAGLLIAVLGLLSAALLYKPPRITEPSRRKGHRSWLPYLYGLFVVIGLGTLSVLFVQAQAIQRLLATDHLDERRLQIWGPTVKMVWKYFPVGSGIGSFPEVFQIDEPSSMLLPSYVNHAHNDWLEVAMTAGVPGILLLAAVVIAWAVYSLRVWRIPGKGMRDITLARAGAVILLLFALASLGDYPLRVPSLMCFGVIAALWLANATRTAQTFDSGSERHGVSTDSGLAVSRGF